MYQDPKPDDGSKSQSPHTSSPTQNALQNWGFECTCVICTSHIITPTQTLQHRNNLLDDLESRFKHFNGVQLLNAENLLAALENTYSVPASQVPRLAIWQPYLFLTRQHASANNPAKTISTALNLLHTLGFITEGLPAKADKQSSTFQIKQWGLLVDHVIEVFMHIWKACRTIEPGVCESVERVARMAYMICVGEEDTFWGRYGKWYGMRKM
jgi:hypothetical protein